MFISGLIPQLELQSDSDSESDSETPQQTSHEPVSVPRCFFTPCDALVCELGDSVNPLSPCDRRGYSCYTRAVQICGDHINAGCNDCTCQ